MSDRGFVSDGVRGRCSFSVSFLYKEFDDFARIREEKELIQDVAQLLRDAGYRFVIVDSDGLKKSSHSGDSSFGE